VLVGLLFSIGQLLFFRKTSVLYKSITLTHSRYAVLIRLDSVQHTTHHSTTAHDRKHTTDKNTKKADQDALPVFNQL
jgi:ABC-type nickel/cobalt efflux system permease component RcnA